MLATLTWVYITHANEMADREGKSVAGGWIVLFFSARNLFLTKSESVAIEMYFCLSVSHSLKLEHLRFEQKSSGGQTKRPTSRIRERRNNRSSRQDTKKRRGGE